MIKVLYSFCLGDDDDCDLVFKDLDEESDNFLQSGLIVTTRSGRNAGSWKLAFTD